jgi:hypothetical protein
MTQNIMLSATDFEYICTKCYWNLKEQLPVVVEPVTNENI